MQGVASARRTWGAAALSTLLIWAAPVAAQEPSEDPEATAPTADPEPRRARLDEILVTAQKREENIQDVPLSVTAIGGDAIEEQQMADLQDLSKFAPNTKINATAGIEYVYMRGLGSNGNRGFEQSVGVFLDGVHFGRTLFLSFGLTDIDRVEVLRGPQGTLFGKNTIAGAVNVLTNVPHDDWEARFGARIGNRRARHFEAILNAPILDDDRLGVRMVLQKSDTDGHVDNSHLNVKEADSDRQGIRLKIRSVPADNLEIILAGSFETYDSEGWGGQISIMPNLFKPIVGAFDPATEYSDTDYHTVTNSEGGTDRETATATLTANYDLGLNTLTLIAAHAQYDDEFRDDIDNTAAPIVSYRGIEEFNQQSIELRFTSGPGDFDYVAGLYGVRNTMHLTSFGSLISVSSLDELTPRLLDILDILLPNRPLTLDSFDTDVEIDSLSFAAYGQANWHATSALTLTFGLRFSWERKRLDFLGYQDATILVQTIIGAEKIDQQRELTESDLSPKVALSYAFTDDIMAYAMAARGFKAGGYNVSTFTNDKLEFGPEKSTTFEAGVKTTWLDGQALLNLSLFHTRFEDLQVSTFSGINFVVNNAASAISQGVEIDGMVSPVEGLYIIASSAFLHAHYIDRQNGPCPNVDPNQDLAGFLISFTGQTDVCDLSGKRLPYAPKWQGSLAVSYETPLFNWPLMAGVSGAALYQGHVFFQEDQDPNDAQPRYWRFDAGVSLRDVDEAWSINASVRNITDQVVRMFAADVPVLAGAHVSFVEPPRTYLLEVRANF